MHISGRPKQGGNSFSSMPAAAGSVSKDLWRNTVFLDWVPVVCYGAVWIEIIHGQIKCLQWDNGLQINALF